MSKKLAVSGFAGTGKSTIIKPLFEDSGIFISIESAREVFSTKDFFNLNLSDTDLSKVFQKSIIDNEISKLNTTYLNNIPNYVSDRSIIDNLTYAQIYYGKDFINFNIIEEYLQEFCENHDTKHLFDLTLYIEPCHDVASVRDVILSDPMRVATSTSSINEFIENSKIWNDLFLETFERLPIVCEDIKIMEHFTKNPNFKKDSMLLMNDFFGV